MQQTLNHGARRHLIEVPCPPDFHDLPAERFQHCFNYWVHRDFWPVTLSFASHDGGIFATGSFQRARGRRVRHLMRRAELEAEVAAQRRLGQRPHQISVVDLPDGLRYSAIWGPSRGEWVIDFELDGAAYNNLWHQRRAEQWIQVDLAIASGAPPRITSIWEKRPFEAFEDYASYWGMTAQQYQDRFNQFWANGLRVTRFCRYRDGGQERIGAIWSRTIGRWAQYFGLDHAGYQAHYEDFAGRQGFRVYQLQSYENRFAVVWHVPGVGRSLGAALTSGPTASSRGQRRLDVAYRGADRSAHWISTDGGAWSAPQSLGGRFISELASASWDAARIDLFGQGLDNRLYTAFMEGGRWSGWIPLGDLLGSAPASCSWGPGRLDVFYRGPGGDLMHRTFNGGWTAPVSRGGALTSKPAAVSWAPNRLDVFARGTDSALWHLWFDGSWHAWETLGGVLRSAPAVSSWSSGRLDVFVRGTDDALYHKYFDGAWSGWQGLGGLLTADPAAVSWGPNRIDVFARGSDAALWRRIWDGAWLD